MSDMTVAEKIELALIPVAGATVWALGDRLPGQTGIGTLVLIASALLLAQGLIRDLWLLFRGNLGSQTGAARQALCMCVESGVGMTGVIAGLVILGSAVDYNLPTGPWFWPSLSVGVLAIGFAIKDLVFDWRPLRIRRDKDHMNIIVSWKS